VDYALREVVLEQTEKLDAVRTVEQVWIYLIGEKDGEKKDAGLLAKLFQEQVTTHTQTHKHTNTQTHTHTHTHIAALYSQKTQGGECMYVCMFVFMYVYMYVCM
jgi:hypothetical protein